PDNWTGRIWRLDRHRLHKRLHQQVVDRTPESAGSIAERVAVAHYDQVETRDHDDDLVLRTGAGKGVARRFRPDAVGIRVPGQSRWRRRVGCAAMGTRHALIGQYLSDDVAPDQLATVPLALEHHKLSDSRRRARGEAGAAPVRVQLQPVHLISGAVADGPLI